MREGEAAEVEAERLTALAALGRARARDAIALVRSEIDGRTARLGGCLQAAASGAPPPEDAEPLLEELELLVRCAGHLLADAADNSDAAEVPAEVAAAAGGDGGGAAGAHPAVSLVESVVGGLLQQQLGAAMQSDDPRVGPLAPILSPLLAEALLWFLQRVAASYLMPDEASTSVLCPPLLAAWGRDTAGGAALLTACVEAAAVYLLRWRGEPALARAACSLLASLARLSAAAPLMPSLPATRRLVELPASTLPGRAQRLLYEALCRAALAAADDAAPPSASCAPRCGPGWWRRPTAVRAQTRNSCARSRA